MPYINPFRRFGGNHYVHIIDNIVPHYPGQTTAGPGTSIYQLKVVCTCQFEVLCVDQAEADMWMQSHLAMHGQSENGEPPTPTLRSPHDPAGSGNAQATRDNKVTSAEQVPTR